MTIRAVRSAATRRYNRPMVASAARRTAFDLLMRTRVHKYLGHRYDYMFTPSQLAFLVSTLDEALSVEGNIVEVGCAYGHTTVFLNRHLDEADPGRRYFAVDTFSGFTEDDIEHERTQRGRLYDYGDFRFNSLGKFTRTMDRNGITRVTPIRADANTFRFEDLAPIAFCLVDVDLYQVVTNTLDRVHPLVPAGGAIVVDDCDEDHPVWGGGYEAYRDFVARMGLPCVIERRKLGLIRK